MTCTATAQLHPAYGSVLLTMAIEPEEIGRRVKAARKRRHWTQLDFALEAHVSLSSVARWEAGKLPRVSELIRVADVLGVPTETLVEPEPIDEDKFALILDELRSDRERLEERLQGLEDAVLGKRSSARSRPARGEPK